jgi:hypothetical protein
MSPNFFPEPTPAAIPTIIMYFGLKCSINFKDKVEAAAIPISDC